ncbi:hypothetical protein SAMN05216276_100327 [Streptosporangium subroseum]|uniref:Uncharacterized protein n=1 Tax=Streptosporangium subroseum TaxID=106412 RepID=A0A239B857_9ACTN|nr:DUF6368 family protein [Streptosporangium subroseum]SNS04050.1 hypothetical protein SAMN05216276_100327 [Streptosporangium subroseum]
MAGPALVLLLMERRERSDFADFVPWLKTFCSPIEVTDDGSLDFWVRDPSFLGAPVTLDDTGFPGFHLSQDAEFGADGGEYSAFTPQPVQGLLLYANASGHINHLLLGYLALAMAHRLGALIEFDGLLGYGHRLLELGAESGDHRAEAWQLVSSLPGVIKEVSWGTPDDDEGQGWFHVGDAEFLAAWLAHPEFHLIK